MISHTTNIVDPDTLDTQLNTHLADIFKQEIPKLLKQRKDDNNILPGFGNPIKAYNQSVEDYINGGFIEYFKETQDHSNHELEQLRDICEKSEQIRLGFAYFSLLKEEDRAQESLDIVADLRRTAWEETGLLLENDEENDEIFNIPREEMATYILPHAPADHPYGYFEASTALTGQLSNEISEDEKDIINRFAIDLIVADSKTNEISSRIGRAFYEHNRSERLQRECRELRHIETALETLQVTAREVTTNRAYVYETDSYEKLQDFWENTHSAITTQHIKDSFAVLSCMHKDMAEGNYWDKLDTPEDLLQCVWATTEEALRANQSIAVCQP
jgi:hypothetical protein